MTFDIPGSCTLPSADRPVRLAELDTMLGTAESVTRDSKTDITLHFSGVVGLGDRVRDLTARESQCCSFFHFDVVEDDLEVVLRIEVPPHNADILDSIQSRVRQRA